MLLGGFIGPLVILSMPLFLVVNQTLQAILSILSVCCKRLGTVHRLCLLLLVVTFVLCDISRQLFKTSRYLVQLHL